MAPIPKQASVLVPRQVLVLALDEGLAEDLVEALVWVMALAWDTVKALALAWGGALVLGLPRVGLLVQAVGKAEDWAPAWASAAAAPGLSTKTKTASATDGKPFAEADKQ